MLFASLLLLKAARGRSTHYRPAFKFKFHPAPLKLQEKLLFALFEIHLLALPALSYAPLVLGWEPAYCFMINWPIFAIYLYLYTIYYSSLFCAVSKSLHSLPFAWYKSCHSLIYVLVSERNKQIWYWLLLFLDTKILVSTTKYVVVVVVCIFSVQDNNGH